MILHPGPSAPVDPAESIPVEKPDVLDAFERLAGVATREFDVDEMLRELCRSVAAVLPTAGVGVMRVADRRTVHVHATESRSHRLEQVQDLLQQGPCVQSVQTRQTVVVDDLQATARWPELGEAAADVGLRSAVSLPLATDGAVWGVLDLYRDAPEPLPSGGLRVARALADVATGYIVMAHEREAGRRAHAELAHRALHDPLTGVANRALLFDRLRHALQAARRQGTRVGVLFVDLDDFKQVNDGFGHSVGDRLLVEAARRLGRVLRAGDTLARTGGDEFVVLCENLPALGAEELLRGVTERVRLALAEVTRVGPVELRVDASIGAALAAVGQDDPDAVIHAADAAMYRAKRHARRTREGRASAAAAPRLVRAATLVLTCTECDGQHLLRLRGELDVASADAVRELLEEHAATGRPTVVDLSAVEFADYAGLSVLGARRAAGDGRPHRVTVVGASPLVTRVLTLGGLERLLTGTDQLVHGG